MDVAGITPKRFLLQTGAKNYGVHLGRARTPFVESDPRPGLEPNFYYPVTLPIVGLTFFLSHMLIVLLIVFQQEDILFEYAKKHNIGW